MKQELVIAPKGLKGRVKMRMGTYYRFLVLGHLGVTPKGKALLDVGSYDGYLLSLYQGETKVGLDICPAPRERLFAPMVKGDAKNPPFPDGIFDTVFAIDVMEHEEKDEELLSRLVALVAPDGVLWLSVPSRGYTAFPPFLTGWFHDRWGHVRPGYYPHELLEKLPPGAHIDIRYWNEPFFRLAYVPVRIFWSFWPALGKLILRKVATLDARFQGGLSGHLYARITTEDDAYS